MGIRIKLSSESNRMKPVVCRSILSILVIITTSGTCCYSGSPALAQPDQSQIYVTSRDVTSSPGDGLFIADGWEVKIFKSSNGYTYQGKNSATNASITLFRGRSIKAGDKYLYKWNNSGTVYQLTWKPTDPKYVRVKIFSPRGQEIFNKLMWNPPEI
jgi:hypothetical protein